MPSVKALRLPCSYRKPKTPTPGDPPRIIMPAEAVATLREIQDQVRGRLQELTRTEWWIRPSGTSAVEKVSARELTIPVSRIDVRCQCPGYLPLNCGALFSRKAWTASR